MLHKNDVGKIATPFRIRPNAQLFTQRPSKVPIHYRDKLNTLLRELEKYTIIKQIGSSPQDKPDKPNFLWLNMFESSHYNTKRRFYQMRIGRSTP